MKRRKKSEFGLQSEEDLSVVETAGFERVKGDKSVNRRAGLHGKIDKNDDEQKVKRRKPLSFKHKRRIMRKLALALSAVFVVCIGVVGFGFFNKDGLSTLDENYDPKTVCFETPKDGSTPADHTAVENVGYMNYALQQQNSWSSEMHSTVFAVVMEQSVSTFKSFNNGVMVAADITTSSMVNSAQQFCVSDGRVLWRKAAGNKSTYNGMETPWSTGTPDGNLSERDFKLQRGFPPNEFSVYVINEKTVLEEGTSAAAEKTADGLYSVTLNLNPIDSATDRDAAATYYYLQQMKATGGISGATFKSIKITYTMDANWRVLSAAVSESYSAQMGISANCSSDSLTTYTYENAPETSTVIDRYYNNYFKQYLNTVISPTEEKISAATCLANAFGSVLTEGAIFKVDLAVGEFPLNGVVYVGMENGGLSSLRVKLGDISAQFGEEEGKNNLYLGLGGAKYKLCVDDLAGILPQAQSEEGGGLNMDQLLTDLGGGEFNLAEDGKSATLNSKLNLFGLSLPVNFAFEIDGSKVTLKDVGTKIELNDKTDIAATVKFGTESDIPAEITDKSAYTDIMQDGVSLGLNLGFGGLNLDGGLKLGLKNGTPTDLRAKIGDIGVVYPFGGKNLYISFGNQKYKLDTGLINIENSNLSGLLDENALSGILLEVLSRLTTDENGIKVSTGFGGLLKLALSVCLKGNIGVGLDLGVLDKNISAKVNLNCGVQLPELEDESSYTDILNDGVAVAFNIGTGEFKTSGNAKLCLSNGSLTAVRGDIGGFGIYFDTAEKALYLDMGATAKIKLDIGKLTEGMNLDLDLNGIVRDILKNLNGVENGIEIGSFSLTDWLALGLKLDINGGLKATADINLYGMKASADLSLGSNKDFSKPFGKEEKAGFCDVLAQGFNLSGGAKLSFGGKEIELADLNASLSFENGISVSASTKLIIDGIYNNLFVEYAGGELSVYYGDEIGGMGVTLDLSEEGGELKMLDSAVTSVYNRAVGVIDEIITNNSLKTAENLSDIIEKLGLAKMLSGSTLDIFKTLGIPAKDGKLDIAGLIGQLKIKGSLGGLSAETDNLGLNIGFKESGLDLSAQISTIKTTLTVEKVNLTPFKKVCPPENAKLLTAEEICETIDYIGAGLSLITEDSYSLKLGADLYADGALSQKVGVGLEYIKGESFPVKITLPKTDENGNKTAFDFAFAEDMYFHLSVSIDEFGAKVDKNGEPVKDEQGNTVLKDDLYLDFWILDNNPAVNNGLTTGEAAGTGEGLDVFVSVSNFTPDNEKYAPLLIYAPVNEILTILSAGLAVINLDSIDLSAVSKQVDEILTVVSTMINDSLVKKYLPYTYEQFSSLGASLIPQILGNDLNGFVQELIKSLSEGVKKAEAEKTEGAGGTGAEGTGETTLPEGTQPESNETLPEEGKKQPERGNYIKGFTLGGKDGYRTVDIVLDSSSIYGDGFDDMSFTFLKYYDYPAMPIAEEGTPQTISRFGGASVNNIYFGGNKKLDLSLGVEREVTKKTSFKDFYDFSGVSTLLQAAVNSATHKSDDGYKLNDYYYIDGNIELEINLTLGSLNIEAAKANVNLALSVGIDKNNEVTLNARVSYPAVKKVIVVINGRSTLDLTVKGGMIYMKRTQFTEFGFLGENTLSTPYVVYRAMTLKAFGEDIMNQIGFMFNLGSDITKIINDAAGKQTAKDNTVYDIGKTVSDILKGFTHSGDENQGNWTLTLNGKGIGGLAGFSKDISLSDIIVAISAKSKYDELTNTRPLTVTGLDLSTSLDVAGALSIGVTGGLNYCNPQQVMNSGTTDITSSQNGMWEKLLGCDSKTMPDSQSFKNALASQTAHNNYIEVGSASAGLSLGYVKLYTDGEQTGEIQILYSASGVMHSPEVPVWEERTGYKLTVNYSGCAEGNDGKLNITDCANASVSAVYTPNRYSVKLESLYNLSGNSEEEYFESVIDYAYGTTLPLGEYLGRTVQIDGILYALQAFKCGDKVYTGDVENFNTLCDITLTAVWGEVDYDAEYTIKFVAAGQETELKLKYGEEISTEGIPYPAVAGYRFEGWDMGNVTTVYGNRVIKAIYVPDTFEVYLNLDDLRADWTNYNDYDYETQLSQKLTEAGFTDGKLLYTYGKKAITLKNISALHGYEFVRYYVISNGEKVTITQIDKITADMVIYAEFKNARLTVEFKASEPFGYGDKTAAEKDGEYSLEYYFYYDGDCHLAQPAGTNIYFFGWYVKGESGYEAVTDLFSVVQPGGRVALEGIWLETNVTAAVSKYDDYVGIKVHVYYTITGTVSYRFVGNKQLITELGLEVTGLSMYGFVNNEPNYETNKYDPNAKNQQFTPTADGLTFDENNSASKTFDQLDLIDNWGSGKKTTCHVVAVLTVNFNGKSLPIEGENTQATCATGYTK